jgi:hypothetical protein
MAFNRASAHLRVQESLHQIYLAKNADYGNSFGESYEEWGIISAVVRMDDKMRRLKQLTKKSAVAQVKEESIKDTLLDLANYAIMAVMELEAPFGKEESKCSEGSSQ